MTRLISYFMLGAIFMAVGVFWKNSPNPRSKEEIIASIEKNLEAEVNKWKLEFEFLAGNVDSQQAWGALTHDYFVHNDSGVNRWSTNRYYPDPAIVHADSILYYHNGNKQYLVLQKLLGNGKTLTGFLILQEGFEIQNQYLSTRLNSKIFPPVGVSMQKGNDAVPVFLKGVKLFSITINNLSNDGQVISVKAWFIFLMGAFLFLSSSWFLIKRLKRNDLKWAAVVLGFFSLSTFRLAMVFGNFPSLSNTNPIFNPGEFASSSFNNSIGNLLLNTIALFLVAVLTHYLFSKTSFTFWKRKSPGVKGMVVTGFLILFFSAQLLPFLYLETIYHNSSITPDISKELLFSGIRWCALGCIILSSGSGIFFSLTFFRIVTRIYRSEWKNYLFCGTIAALLFFLYHVLTARSYEIPFILTMINLVVLVYITINRKAKLIWAGLSSLILLELIVYSSQIALANRLLSNEREHEAMLKFGNTYLIERDILGEYLLAQTIDRIDQDPFIRQQMVNPFNRFTIIEQKIKVNHLNPYFDRYNINIYLFDSKGTPVGGVNKKNLPKLIQGFAPLAENTGYKGVYTIRNQNNRLIKRYLAVIPVKYHLAGYVVIELALMQVIPNSVFPKLLLDSRFSSYANSSRYSYAIVKGDSIISLAGSYNYQNSSVLKVVSQDEFDGNEMTIDNRDHIVLRGQEREVTIVSSESYRVLYLIANFAFYFFIGISLLVLVFIVFYASSLNRQQLTYSNRIRLYVYLAFVLPLVALSLIILRVNSFSERNQSEENSIRQATNLATSLAPVFANTNDNMEDELASQSLGVGVDITAYSKNGIMVASTQPDIYSNQLFSRYIDPKAWNRISSGDLMFTIDDEIGSLKFRNTYSVVLSPDDREMLGVVSVPYFESQESLEKDQISLVTNILAVFVAVFILFYILSYVALNWLTSPLKAISASLQRTTLSGSNKKLLWESNDEIGSMVKEYNKMIDNLAKSKDELEKKQREAAWRELARQVAHEIKNPLTPIKLTLQQLQRTIQEGRSVEKAAKSIDTVLHQVNILNDIASSFSAFAQMPEPKLEQVEIVSLIHEVATLFNSEKADRVKSNYKGEPIFVMFDKQLFTRIFSNIILNGLQSEKENEPIRITIDITVHPPNITLSFDDNGEGISEELQDKIFIPYFSTKETGSGLGLAIAKQGVEQCGGRIWCDSKPGEGSTFYINLPLENLQP